MLLVQQPHSENHCLNRRVSPQWRGITSGFLRRETELHREGPWLDCDGDDDDDGDGGNDSDDLDQTFPCHSLCASLCSKA